MLEQPADVARKLALLVTKAAASNWPVAMDFVHGDAHVVGWVAGPVEEGGVLVTRSGFELSLPDGSKFRVSVVRTP